MYKNFFKILGATAFMSVFLGFASFADVVSSVTISFTEDKTEQGVIYEAEPKVSGKATIYDWEVSSPYVDWKVGHKVSFTIELEAYDGYAFGKSKTSVKVSGDNAELAKKTINSDGMTLVVNYWPTMQLANPENIYFEDDFNAVWDEVEYCSLYEVKIYRDEKAYKTVETSKEEIDLEEYATDGSEVTFAVRAVPKNDTQSKYLKASEWVDCDDSTSSSSDNTVYGDFSGKTTSLVFKDDDGNTVSGWQYINGSWYYFDPENSNKAVTDCWQNIDGAWYRFNSYGIMQSGWIKDNGYWYYCNSSTESSTYGQLQTGWIQSGPGGPKYYCNTGENVNMPLGAMYTDTTTPDGHTVGSDGACYDEFTIE